MSLTEMQAAIAQLSPSEKALVLQSVAKDLQGASVGIESRDDVSGGEACIVRTSIPVWLLVQLRRANRT